MILLRLMQTQPFLLVPTHGLCHVSETSGSRNATIGGLQQLSMYFAPN